MSKKIKLEKVRLLCWGVDSTGIETPKQTIKFPSSNKLPVETDGGDYNREVGGAFNFRTDRIGVLCDVLVDKNIYEKDLDLIPNLLGKTSETEPKINFDLELIGVFVSGKQHSDEPCRHNLTCALKVGEQMSDILPTVSPSILWHHGRKCDCCGERLVLVCHFGYNTQEDGKSYRMCLKCLSNWSHTILTRLMMNLNVRLRTRRNKYGAKRNCGD